LNDRFLGPVSVYLVREYRILAYAQFLEAYKRSAHKSCVLHTHRNSYSLHLSVMLSSMADSFGMPIALLDAELSRFIAAGRLSAKIDKVGDVVATSRPDRRDAQYQAVIKKGDVLLNQIQKLVRAIDV
jgi:26S proteasome regulatory subunit N7